MEKKKTMRLTESDIRNMVLEITGRLLKEDPGKVNENDILRELNEMFGENGKLKIPFSEIIEAWEKGGEIDFDNGDVLFLEWRIEGSWDSVDTNDDTDPYEVTWDADFRVDEATLYNEDGDEIGKLSENLCRIIGNAIYFDNQGDAVEYLPEDDSYYDYDKYSGMYESRKGKRLAESYDSGEFTPIGTPGGYQYKGKNPVEAKKERLLGCMNAIGSKVYTEMEYLKNVCDVQNPMFIAKIEDPKERRIAQRAWDVYAKSMDLYRTVISIKDEIGNLE